LREDYFIFHLREITGSPSAADLLAAQGDCISQVVRGETQPLSRWRTPGNSSIQDFYYPSDLAVIGWNAAFVYDTPSGAETAIQLLQYANSQLLEFRHYDELLTKQLEGVYDFSRARRPRPLVALAHRPRRFETPYCPARRERTHPSAPTTHQVPSATCFPHASTNSPLRKLACPTTRPRPAKTANRRRALPLHGGRIQPKPRLRPGTHGGHHSDHRTRLFLSAANAI